MRYLVQARLGGCITWDGRKLGMNITVAIGMAIVRSLQRPSPAPLRPRTRALYAHRASEIGISFACRTWVDEGTLPDR
jgi:hypothetical protein